MLACLSYCITKMTLKQCNNTLIIVIYLCYYIWNRNCIQTALKSKIGYTLKSLFGIFLKTELH